MDYKAIFFNDQDVGNAPETIEHPPFSHQAKPQKKPRTLRSMSDGSGSGHYQILDARKLIK
jgi:hypothetical protein